MISLVTYLYTLTSLPGILCPTVILVITASLLRSRVRSHGRVPLASTLIKANSRFYAAVSLYLLITLLLSRIISSNSTIWLLPSDVHRRYFYHLSKFYEYIDIFLVLANGGQIGLHFGFHHLTTPYLTYLRVLNDHRGWELFAGLNALHHVLMYGYFGGVSTFRPMLPWTGTLQLAIGIVTEITLIWLKLVDGEVLWPNVVACLLLGCYGILFVRDIQIEKREDDKAKQGGSEDQGSGEVLSLPPAANRLKVD